MPEEGWEYLLEILGRKSQNYLQALFPFVTRVSGSHGFIPLLGDFFYLLLTLFLHLLHLTDALAPLVTEGKDKHLQVCLHAECVPAGTVKPTFVRATAHPFPAPGTLSKDHA